MKTTQMLCVALALAIGTIQTTTIRPLSINSIDSEHKPVSTKSDVVPPELVETNKQPEPNTAESDSAKTPEDLSTSASNRRNKMLDFFGGFYPHPMMYQNQFFQPHQFYDDSGTAPEDEDTMARGNRRKQSSGQNSPIFYIRLPPTPYMYVPGMGYISQPPTIRPMQIAPPIPPPVVNPFINVPVNFLSNGKPTNVYEWPGASQVNFGQPQYPSYLPNRPVHQQRPAGYRPHKPSYLPDSKIHHLKGPYVFNGRPDDIYVLPQNGPPQQSQFSINPFAGQGFASGHDYSNVHQQQQHDYSSPHHQQHDFGNPHHQQQPDYSGLHHYNPNQQAYNNAPVSRYSGYNPAYNPGYNSIYPEALSNYY